MDKTCRRSARRAAALPGPASEGQEQAQDQRRRSDRFVVPADLDPTRLSRAGGF